MSSVQKSSPSPKFDYDLLVIGCGPAGQRAAVQAAKLQKKVAIVDKREAVGGVCVNTGAVPSKSFRESVLFLSGYRQRHLYGAEYKVKSDIEMGDLTFRCERLVQIEIEVIKNQLSRNNVEIIVGQARFVDAHTLAIARGDGKTELKTADKILIAVGAHPIRPPKVEFDESVIFDTEGILRIKDLPRSLVVIGAGVLGTEYGSMFAALGVQVTLIDKLKKPLHFLDDDIVEALHYQMRGAGITLRLGEEVLSARSEGGRGVVNCKGDKQIVAECVLCAVGRQSTTDDLDLDKIGIEITSRGKIAVSDSLQSKVPNVYAAGDVLGFPALASVAAVQGRRAAIAAFAPEETVGEFPAPYAMYSIPEVAFVGISEKDASRDGIPYEVGLARYREITRGHILGDENGLLKLLFNRETGKLLGVHIIGEQATELVHIGQAVMGCGGDVKYLSNAVFNYPTLSECYKVAALDGLNKLKRAKDPRAQSASKGGTAR